MIEIKIKDRVIAGNVEQIVCKHLDLSTSELVKSNYSNNASMARGYIFYLLHYDCGMSINKIGLLYERTGRGVAHLISCTKCRIANQKLYRSAYTEMSDKVKKILN